MERVAESLAQWVFGLWFFGLWLLVWAEIACVVVTKTKTNGRRPDI
jgi:hypothetical protein